MADRYLLKVADLTSTDANDIYTVPTTAAGGDGTAPVYPTTAIVKSIIVSSDDTSNDSTITVVVRRSSANYSIYKNKVVASIAHHELLTSPLVLNESDILRGTAGHADRVHVLVSVLEISQT